MCYFYREVDDGAVRVRGEGGDGALGSLFPNRISSWDEYFLVGIIKLSQCLQYCKGGNNLTCYIFCCLNIIVDNIKVGEAGRKTIFAENTSKRASKFRNEFFLPVRTLPTQIGFDGVRNPEPKLSCLGPLKKEDYHRVLTPPLTLGVARGNHLNEQNISLLPTEIASDKAKPYQIYVKQRSGAEVNTPYK